MTRLEAAGAQALWPSCRGRLDTLSRFGPDWPESGR